MKKLTIITASVVAAACSWAGQGDIVPSVGLVHFDGQDVNTYYNYLAAVPVFRFWDAARLTEAPLLSDGAPIANEDGVAASRLVVVGNAPESKVDEVRAAYGVAAENTATLDGNVPSVAAELAGNWARARDVVVAPYAPGGDKDAVASASYAAALASAINAPLLYTYTKRAPYETLSALRRLGAKNVYVVDFGRTCDEEVIARIGAEGRNLGRRFARPGEVDSFVDTHLRQSENKNLPREA